MKRLFFGLEITGEARQAAESVLARLTSDVVHQGTRWGRAEKLHLTVVFLGHVPEENIEVLSQIGGRVASEFAPLSLAVTDLGGFPHIGRPKVVWLGVEESEGLTRLQSRLVEELSPVVAIEDREYHPHVTLGRVSPGSPKVGAKVRALSEELALTPSPWTANELILFESTADGRYDVISRYTFPYGEAVGERLDR